MTGSSIIDWEKELSDVYRSKKDYYKHLRCFWYGKRLIVNAALSRTRGGGGGADRGIRKAHAKFQCERAKVLSHWMKCNLYLTAFDQMHTRYQDVLSKAPVLQRSAVIRDAAAQLRSLEAALHYVKWAHGWKKDMTCIQPGPVVHSPRYDRRSMNVYIETYLRNKGGRPWPRIRSEDDEDSDDCPDQSSDEVDTDTDTDDCDDCSDQSMDSDEDGTNTDDSSDQSSDSDESEIDTDDSSDQTMESDEDEMDTDDGFHQFVGEASVTSCMEAAGEGRGPPSSQDCGSTARHQESGKFLVPINLPAAYSSRRDRKRMCKP